ncbi:MAG: hypothetical protein HYX57_11055 [Chloroflexi bacterium]|nr:hypothetical protein [Chloroflexota bacterium]
MINRTHGEAQELLADLVLDAGAVDKLADTSLAAHVESCAECGRDLRAGQRTRAAVRAALVGPYDPAHPLRLAELAHDEPIPAPAALRSVVKNRARIGIMEPSAGVEPLGAEAPRVGVGVGRRFLPGGRFLPLVAALALLVASGGLLLEQGARLDEARAETAALQAVTATLDRILADPAHRLVDLRTADGSVNGSLSWSSRDIAVLTLALDPPSRDQVYLCWIERDGVRSPVGRMRFAGRAAFWTGSLDEWATTTFDAGGTFGISLEPVSGPVGNPAILVADLGG